MGLDDGVCEGSITGAHVWKLTGLGLGDGVQAEYECEVCGRPMMRLPGQPFPGTV